MLELEAREFFTSDTQCVAVEPHAPQPAFPVHEHDFCELVIVASGNGWHVLDDEPHLLSCGELLYLSPEDRHYRAHAQPDSPPLRDDNPSVVLIPGVGMLSFGKTKSEARIVSEFYTNAIHVMEGATALGNGSASRNGPSEGFTVHDNYVALPLAEAFGIEYWQLEEAKLRR